MSDAVGTGGTGSARGGRRARYAGIALVLLLALAAAGFFGLRYATALLKTQVEAALGETSEIGAIDVGWSAIEVRDLRIRAPRDWPAQDTLQAARIIIVPDLRGLLSDRSRVHIHSITIDDAYLSVLRTRSGRLRLLPSLLETKKDQGDGAVPSNGAIEVAIGKVELRGGRVEFFDASVKQPAHRMRLEQLHASVEQLQVPSLAGRTGVTVDGVIKGVRRDGRLAVSGWLELAAKNSQLNSRLVGVDLVALQPYLIKAAETGVKRGTLEMQLQSTVKANRLHAPGKLTLTDLELREKSGAVGTFMGLPRQAVVAGLKDRNNRITIQFTLEGKLDDPRFSLNENFAKSIGAATAGLLGISIEGLAKHLGNAPQAIGSAIKNLFGQ
ncbi:DUF748 domain-containing protein [Noviherbaspirillum sedimenti]|uniref:DUF748 domain-containing protein n=1 Tax=Noviherbaspirillum sedimenti TaxID=2320865 RepID=A0A3A3G7D1_9BURK|nr:DUF748 domain-containing protein [Noviherbaspirillum sedimenti]RJG02462.1 DUF748 domain-containing protein [Noviherbaspirillum sedimenti]